MIKPHSPPPPDAPLTVPLTILPSPEPTLASPADQKSPEQTPTRAPKPLSQPSSDLASTLENAQVDNTKFTPEMLHHQALQASARGPGAGGPRIDGLYLHTPFCFHKCHYCDFYSIVEPKTGGGAGGGADRQSQFTEALIGELRSLSHRYALTPETIFVGGGTPTLLRLELWERLLEVMRAVGVLERVREFSVEANPETVTPELMALLVAGGVNRISMGVQSFQPHLLKALERWHDPASVPKAVEMVRAAGISNFNLDLIFAIPGQTMADLEADLEAVLALEPAHLSCYSLIFEPHTPLTQKMKLGQIQPMDEETERAMYERVLSRLAAAGYEHYEVSNWARRGAEGRTFFCQHNLLYWHNRNWLGLGPAAASHVEGRRWKNVPHLGRYLAGAPTPPIQDEEELPADRRVGERLMLALRLREGIELEWLTEHLAPDDPRHITMQEFVDLGLLERTTTHLRLTDAGLFVADAMIAKLL